jgi:hypothetical protein
MRKLDGRIKGRSNKSFDRSGISLDVIENSDAIRRFSRPVNSSDRPTAKQEERDHPPVGWKREASNRSLNDNHRLRSIESLQPTG